MVATMARQVTADVLTFAERSEAARRGALSLTPAQRSERTRKGWLKRKRAMKQRTTSWKNPPQQAPWVRQRQFSSLQMRATLPMTSQYLSLGGSLGKLGNDQSRFEVINELRHEVNDDPNGPVIADTAALMMGAPGDGFLAATAAGLVSSGEGNDPDTIRLDMQNAALNAVVDQNNFWLTNTLMPPSGWTVAHDQQLFADLNRQSALLSNQVVQAYLPLDGRTTIDPDAFADQVRKSAEFMAERGLLSAKQRAQVDNDVTKWQSLTTHRTTLPLAPPTLARQTPGVDIGTGQVPAGVAPLQGLNTVAPGTLPQGTSLSPAEVSAREYYIQALRHDPTWQTGGPNDTETIYNNASAAEKAKRDAQKSALVDTILAEAAARGVQRRPKGQRHLLITGGPVGSGKSTALAAHEAELGGPFLLVNVDDVTDRLIALGMVPTMPGLTPAESVHLVRNEADKLRDVVFARAMAAGYDIAYDTTMGYAPYAQGIAAQAHAKGYADPVALFVNVDTQQSIDSAKTRWVSELERYLRDGDAAPVDGGRFISPNVPARNKPKRNSNLPSGSAESFVELARAGTFDKVLVIDNQGNFPSAVNVDLKVVDADNATLAQVVKTARATVAQRPTDWNAYALQAVATGELTRRGDGRSTRGTPTPTVAANPPPPVSAAAAPAPPPVTPAPTPPAPSTGALTLANYAADPRFAQFDASTNYAATGGNVQRGNAVQKRIATTMGKLGPNPTHAQIDAVLAEWDRAQKAKPVSAQSPGTFNHWLYNTSLSSLGAATGTKVQAMGAAPRARAPQAPTPAAPAPAAPSPATALRTAMTGYMTAQHGATYVLPQVTAPMILNDPRILALAGTGLSPTKGQGTIMAKHFSTAMTQANITSITAADFDAYIDAFVATPKGGGRFGNAITALTASIASRTGLAPTPAPTPAPATPPGLPPVGWSANTQQAFLNFLPQGAFKADSRYAALAPSMQTMADLDLGTYETRWGGVTQAEVDAYLNAATKGDLNAPYAAQGLHAAVVNGPGSSRPWVPVDFTKLHSDSTYQALSTPDQSRVDLYAGNSTTNPSHLAALTYLHVMGIGRAQGVPQIAITAADTANAVDSFSPTPRAPAAPAAGLSLSSMTGAAAGAPITVAIVKASPEYAKLTNAVGSHGIIDQDLGSLYAQQLLTPTSANVYLAEFDRQINVLGQGPYTASGAALALASQAKVAPAPAPASAGVVGPTDPSIGNTPSVLTWKLGGVTAQVTAGDIQSDPRFVALSAGPQSQNIAVQGAVSSLQTPASQGILTAEAADAYLDEFTKQLGVSAQTPIAQNLTSAQISAADSAARTIANAVYAAQKNAGLSATPPNPSANISVAPPAPARSFVGHIAAGFGPNAHFVATLGFVQNDPRISPIPLNAKGQGDILADLQYAESVYGGPLSALALDDYFDNYAAAWAVTHSPSMARGAGQAGLVTRGTVPSWPTGTVAAGAGVSQPPAAAPAPPPLPSTVTGLHNNWASDPRAAWLFQGTQPSTPGQTAPAPTPSANNAYARTINGIDRLGAALGLTSTADLDEATDIALSRYAKEWADSVAQGRPPDQMNQSQLSRWLYVARGMAIADVDEQMQLSARNPNPMPAAIQKGIASQYGQTALNRVKQQNLIGPLQRIGAPAGQPLPPIIPGPSPNAPAAPTPAPSSSPASSPAFNLTPGQFAASFGAGFQPVRANWLGDARLKGIEYFDVQAAADVDADFQIESAQGNFTAADVDAYLDAYVANLGSSLYNTSLTSNQRSGVAASARAVARATLPSAQAAAAPQASPQPASSNVPIATHVAGTAWAKPSNPVDFGSGIIDQLANMPPITAGGPLNVDWTAQRTRRDAWINAAGTSAASKTNRKKLADAADRFMGHAGHSSVPVRGSSGGFEGIRHAAYQIAGRNYPAIRSATYGGVPSALDHDDAEILMRAAAQSDLVPDRDGSGEHKMYRGIAVTAAEAAKYQKGVIVTDPLGQYTTKPDYARAYMDLRLNGAMAVKGRDQGVIFEVVDAHGVPVTPLNYSGRTDNHGLTDEIVSSGQFVVEDVTTTTDPAMHFGRGGSGVTTTRGQSTSVIHVKIRQISTGYDLDAVGGQAALLLGAQTATAPAASSGTAVAPGGSLSIPGQGPIIQAIGRARRTIMPPNQASGGPKKSKPHVAQTSATTRGVSLYGLATRWGTGTEVPSITPAQVQQVTVVGPSVTAMGQRKYPVPPRGPTPVASTFPIVDAYWSFGGRPAPGSAEGLEVQAALDNIRAGFSGGDNATMSTLARSYGLELNGLGNHTTNDAELAFLAALEKARLDGDDLDTSRDKAVTAASAVAAHYITAATLNPARGASPITDAAHHKWISDLANDNALVAYVFTDQYIADGNKATPAAYTRAGATVDGLEVSGAITPAAAKKLRAKLGGGLPKPPRATSGNLSPSALKLRVGSSANVATPFSVPTGLPVPPPVAVTSPQLVRGSSARNRNRRPTFPPWDPDLQNAYAAAAGVPQDTVLLNSLWNQLSYTENKSIQRNFSNYQWYYASQVTDPQQIAEMTVILQAFIGARQRYGGYSLSGSQLRTGTAHARKAVAVETPRMAAIIAKVKADALTRSGRTAPPPPAKRSFAGRPARARYDALDDVMQPRPDPNPNVMRGSRYEFGDFLGFVRDPAVQEQLASGSWDDGDAVVDAFGLKNYIKTATSRYGIAHGDKPMQLFGTVQGYTDMPDIVTEDEMDEYIRNGEHVVYRGLGDQNAWRQTRDGVWSYSSRTAGGGTARGRGIYFASPSPTDPSQRNNAYQGARGYGSHVIRATFRPDAHIARQADFVQMVNAVIASKDLTATEKTFLLGSNSGYAQRTTPITANDWGQRMVDDPAILAVAFGYDAYYRDEYLSGGGDYLTVLNRTAMRIQATEATHA